MTSIHDRRPATPASVLLGGSPSHGSRPDQDAPVPQRPRRRRGGRGDSRAAAPAAPRAAAPAERPAPAQPRRAPSDPATREGRPPSSMNRTAPERQEMPRADLTFAELGVAPELVRVLAADGKTTAFPIQAATLPDSLSGRDVLGRGRTGSGKTLAFALPLVTGLARAAQAGARANAPRRPRGLVLAPTRELATQIAEVIDPLARAWGLRVTTIFGGVKQTRQEQAMRHGTDIIVACPGRLEDLMGQGVIELDGISHTVVDEADLMADMGFLPAVTRILRATPAAGQRMLFSATLDNGVDVLVRRFLHDPVLHSVDPAESPVEQMTHHVFEVADADAKKQLVEALASGTGRRIVFFRTKHRAKRTAKQLTAAGIPAVDLQGNLSQNARDRNLGMFQSGEVRVLVATDVAARGVDVDDVELVVHADPPTEHKEYLHRSGRTARAGNDGDVVTICLPEERRDLADVLRKAKIRVTPERVTASSPAVSALVGKRAPYVAPAPVQQPQPARAKAATPSQQRRAAREAAAASGAGAGNGQRSQSRQSGRPAGAAPHAHSAASVSAASRQGSRGRRPAAR